jgi:phage tail sheath protein FI
MPVTTSYPGIYIQELPSLVHTITPAPTSIAVFVGYTNPFYTSAKYNTATQLFSFADYQANFGGFFSCPWQPDYVGQAVFQFFLNGGPTCYVVAIQAKEYYDSQGISQGQIAAASHTLVAGGGSITFTALQPVGVDDPASPTGTAGISMAVALSNLQTSPQGNPDDTADIVISYGTTVETHRKVQIATLAATLQNSSLVSVAVTGTPTAYPAAGSSKLDYSSLAAPDIAPRLGFSVINPVDFEPVFEQYASLDKVPIFNLLATPGITDSLVTAEAVAYCERKRAFYIMDTPSSEATGWDVNSIVGDLDQSTALSPAPPSSTNAAVYYPWLQTTDPVTGKATDPVTNNPVLAPPSGYVAGIYGKTDSAQGVWQSPAGLQTTLTGTTGVDVKGMMTDPQQGVLNLNAINCLRQFPSIGTVVFGARTTAAANPAFQQWKYVAVRRMALFIEQTLYANLTWAVFEGNSTPLWNALTQEVTAFMLSLFRQGAFAGDTPKSAFLVQCDSTTTTPQDIGNGVVNIVVGFAPLVPAEFVVVKIAQLAGQTQS